MKLILLRYITLLAVLALVGCSTHEKEESSEVSTSVSTDNLEITILKIGKADSIFLTVDGKTVLIDTGEDEDSKEILEYLQDENIQSIDYMILTHFDKDHVGGADQILKTLDVSQVITPDYERDSKEYHEYMTAMANSHIIPTRLKKELSFTAGLATFTIHPPQESSYKQDNDYSLVVSVQHGENSFLFAGDAEKIRLKELIAQGNLKHTFLKVPHHGVYESNSQEFFSMVKPQYAVITSSNKNPEDNKVVKALDSLNTKVYNTRNGDIHVISDGKNIIIEQ